MGNNNQKLPDMFAESHIPEWVSNFSMFDLDKLSEKDFDVAKEKAKQQKKNIFILIDEHKEKFQKIWQLSLFAEALYSNYILLISKKSLIISKFQKEKQEKEEEKEEEKEKEEKGEKEKELNYENIKSLIISFQSQTILSKIDNISNGVLISTLLMKHLPSNSQIPNYLKIARLEFAKPSMEKSTFNMFCYWQGEGAFGKINGITSLKPGWYGNYGEVVEVSFDKNQTNFKKIAQVAKSKGYGCIVHNEEQEKIANEMGIRVGKRNLNEDVRMVTGSENKHYLKSETWYHNIIFNNQLYNKLPLTPLQQARANSLRNKSDIEKELLSPFQIQLISKIEKHFKIISEKINFFPETLEELPEYEERLMKVFEEVGETLF